jgi:PAS domain S-box-containing protein
MSTTPALFESIVEESPDGVLVVQDGDVVYANERLHSLLGYEAGELVGRATSALVAGEGDPFVTSIDENPGTTALTWSAISFETRAGERFSAECSLDQMTHDGSPATVVFCRSSSGNQDSTGSKPETTGVEASQQALTEQLALALDAADAAVWEMDVQTEALHWDERARGMLGYEAGELTGTIEEFERVVHPADWDDLETTYREAIEDSSGYEAEFRVCPDGEEMRWLSVSGQAVTDETGTTDRLIGLARDITARKDRERRIQTLKERFELAVEGAGLGVWDWDITTDEVEFNEQWARMLGYSLDDVEQTLDAWKKRVHPDDLEPVQDELEAHIAGETEYYDTEHRMQTAAGDWKWIRDVGKVVERDETGEAVRAVGIHIDIDERKTSERQLERARAELRQIIDLVPDLIFAKNRDGEYLLANEATAEAYGSTPEEIEGRSESEVIPNAEDSAQFREDDIEVITSGEPKQIPEEKLTTAGGETRILQTRKIPYEVPGTDETAVLGYARDVTDLKEYEQRLATERDFLESVIESLPYPFYVLDVDDYTVEYANSAAEAAEGTTCHNITHNRDTPCDEGDTSFPCPMAAVVDEAEPVTVEHVHPDEAGNERLFQVHASPIFEDGEVSLIAESNIDITDRVQYERTLEEQRDNLEVLNQVVRHDIRNDLQLVLTYAETLQSYVEADGEEYIDKVVEAAHDAVDITTTARDVTQVMLQSRVDRRPTSLRFALESEIEAVRSNHEHALVTVDGTIPSVDVSADDMLESVFRNLLNNAIQHNDKEVPEVTVSVTHDDESVQVRIADNGPGIPDERKEKIFEQGEMSLDSEGTGLGLYLVDTLVDRYDGTVRVEDNDPDGAVFLVALPIADGTA